MLCYTYKWESYLTLREAFKDYLADFSVKGEGRVPPNFTKGKDPKKMEIEYGKIWQSAVAAA